MKQSTPPQASRAPAGFGADTAAIVERLRHAMTLHQGGNFAGAIEIYRPILARYPDHPDVLHYLGMAEYALGNKSRARELFARSIERDGTKAIVHVNLGRTFLNDGEFETALGHFRRAVELGPRDWEALHMLGRALLATDHAYDAAAALESAAALRANFAPILLDLAHAYGSCKRHPMAVRTFEQLLALQPTNVAALGGLSFSLRALNRTSEALACLQKATSLAPTEPRWLCELGGIQEELGNFDAATRIFQDALAERPQYPIALAHLLALRKGAEDPSLAEKAERHVAGNTIQKPVRVQLEFALGKHYDGIREYDRAFAHYRAANELVAEGRPYRPAAVESHVARQMEVFDRALFAAKRALGSESARPLFIVGMPRSGTTLTEQILASHRDVAGAGELAYFNFTAYELARAHGGGDDLSGYARHLDKAALERIASGYLAQLAEVSPQAARVVDKMPMNFSQLGLIALTFPNARIIHCQRDPLDTCLSCYFENFHEDQRYSTRLESLGHYYTQYQRLMRHWQAVLSVPILNVQYESMVADVESQARRLVEFCELEWDANCLNFHRTARAVNTPSRWQVRQPIYGSSVQRWRNYEKHLAPLRAALGAGS
jgi:tetratricopeptide (TPR) repeat protein